MAAERIERPERAVTGVPGTGGGPRVQRPPRRKGPTRVGAPQGNGARPHARVVMDGREPVFDHATSHVLVADRTTGGRPLGGADPNHLSVPSRVRLRLEHVGPWSAFKLALLFGVLVMAAIVVGLVVLYSLLDTAGVLHAVQKLVNTSGVGHHFRFDAGWLLTRVIWVAAGMVVAGAIIVVCLAALYNALADLTGGLDVTFVEHPESIVHVPEAPTWTSRFKGTRLWRHDGIDPGAAVSASDDLPRASGL